MLQAARLSLEDFDGLEGCNEILNLDPSRRGAGDPRRLSAAGADYIETNTFGVNLPNLSEYQIEHGSRSWPRRGTVGTRGGRPVVHPQWPRYVIAPWGRGPLPTLGHARYADLRDAYQQCATGLLEGGVDAIPGGDVSGPAAGQGGGGGGPAGDGGHRADGPSAVSGDGGDHRRDAARQRNRAALTALEPLGIDMIGLNCATGPAEMTEHLRYLAQHARCRCR